MWPSSYLQICVQSSVLHVFCHYHGMFVWKLKQNITMFSTWKKMLMKISTEWMIDFTTHIWWQPPPGGWYSGVRTGPWCWPHSRSPVFVSQSSLASGSWSPRQPLLAQGSSSHPGTLPQTLLVDSKRKCQKQKPSEFYSTKDEGFKNTYQHRWLFVCWLHSGQFPWQTFGWQCLGLHTCVDRHMSSEAWADLRRKYRPEY